MNENNIPNNQGGGNDQNRYSTRDLYLAAALITLKFELLGLDFQLEGRHNDPVGYFSFDKTPNLIEAEQRYWRGDLALEPKAYATNMRSLKSQISNALKNPHSGLK